MSDRPGAHGIVLLDKPAGWTSNRTTRRIQRLFGAQSAGHLGTLDPFATGLLPVMLGDATRLAPWLEGGDKAYVAELAPGVATDTLDRDGAVTETREIPPDVRERLLVALPRFVGTLRQRVPAFSAAKIDGVRRCDLARAGQALEAKFKDVVIRDLRLAEGAAAGPLVLQVTCGPGTYVRQLVADLGDAIGCGAHTSRLRRTRVGAFSADAAVTPELLESSAPESRAEFLVDPSSALPGPLWTAGGAEWSSLAQGRAIEWTGGAAEEALVFVEADGLLRAVTVVRGGRLHPKRVLQHGLRLGGGRP